MRRTARRKPPQPTLPWPGGDQTCPRCHGTRQVYYRITPPGVAVLGGKRVPCRACQGTGTVRAPQTALLADEPPAAPGVPDA